jgi:hypothetical protein
MAEATSSYFKNFARGGGKGGGYGANKSAEFNFIKMARENQGYFDLFMTDQIQDYAVKHQMNLRDFIEILTLVDKLRDTEEPIKRGSKSQSDAQKDVKHKTIVHSPYTIEDVPNIDDIKKEIIKLLESSESTNVNTRDFGLSVFGKSVKDELESREINTKNWCTRLFMLLHLKYSSEFKELYKEEGSPHNVLKLAHTN